MKILKYVYGAVLHTQEQIQFVKLVKMSSNPITRIISFPRSSLDPAVFREKSSGVKLLVILQGQKLTPRFSTDT